MNFEFEDKDDNFNLYERGGDRHIELNRRFNEPLRGSWGGNSDELDVLYPVAQVSASNNSEDDFRSALGEFVKIFSVSYNFDFVAYGMGIGLNEDLEFRGRVRVKGKALDWKVDDILMETGV